MGIFGAADQADVLSTAGINKTINQIIPLAGPEHLAYEEIVDLIIQTLKLRRLKIHIPVPIMQVIISIMEKLSLQAPVTSAQLAILNRDNITSLDVVQPVFGFKPVPLREKIGDILT